MKLGSLGYKMRFSSPSSASWESIVHVRHVPIETVIMDTITAGDVSSVQELISRDVSPNMVIQDHPLLYWSLSLNQYEVSEVLVNAGSHVNHLYADRSPLILQFILRSDLRAVQFLCDHKANLDVRDRSLRYPLFVAVDLENLDLVKILVDAGADVNIKVGNKTLLSWAAEQWFSYGKKTEDIVKYLKKSGAKS